MPPPAGNRILAGMVRATPMASRFAVVLAAAALVAPAAPLAMLGCSSPTLCEPGLCPAGSACDETTGRCAMKAVVATTVPRVFGRFSALALPGLQRAYIGFVPDRDSLACIETHATGTQTTYVAGPARDPAQIAAGHDSAAIADAAGGIHVAYTDAAGAVWYAHRAAAAWQREPVTSAAAGAGHHLAIALWQQAPVIVFDRPQAGDLAFAWRAAAWTIETVAPPIESDGKAGHLTGRLAVSTFGPSVAIAAHDPDRRALVIANRSSGQWSAARLASSAAGGPADGILEPEIGTACAMTRGLAGELIVAYRDATRNHVVLARSDAGATVHRILADGRYHDDLHAVERTRLVGTDLALAVLPGGRLAVALQDGSRLRVQVARETASGGFDVVDVPYAGRPQLAPRVVTQVDGSAAVSWLDMEPTAGPLGGRISTWLLGGTAP